jgi:type I restriction enzyme M protein
MAKTIKADKEESLEKQLWKTADTLRKNIDAAEYKHIVLGLIFLKYISDAFEELYAKLKAEEAEGADPEDKDEYKAENIFFVPQEARWSFLQAKAKLPTIGTLMDEAMDLIEKENPLELKGVLPKVFARQNLDPTSLGRLIDEVSKIALGDTKARSADILGHVFEYFLGEFALAEGKKGGQFYTPRSVVELLVEMLEPYSGRVFDPCCGSGGMFVQSEKFVKDHQGKVSDISIYGQESNQTTWRLAKMNLAIRGIDSSQVKWNTEGSFLNDAHKDVKADYIIANPPFNDSDWGGELIQKDGRWRYGTPPSSNANYAWIQHFLFHLSPNGIAGFVLANTSLSISTGIEHNIRKEIVESDLVDCIVELPAQLFFNTQIPACIWFLSRNKQKRKKEVLFIDAKSMGKMMSRTDRELTPNNIEKISKTYRNWKNEENYSDVAGFCHSASLNDIISNDYTLSSSRYISTVEKIINLEVNFNETTIPDSLEIINEQIGNSVFEIKNNWDSIRNLNIKDLIQLKKLSSDLTSISTLLYQSVIKKYFLDFEINNNQLEMIDSNWGLIPKGWEIKSFEEIFIERKEYVENLGYCPKVYSVTNLGIQAREGKYSKELSKSTSKYKVAYRGDMVFGLSREIPNLDVLEDSIGAFSPAYHIYYPKDVRLGLIVGCIMRLKLMEQTDILKGGAREGRTLDKDRLMTKKFVIPSEEYLSTLWKI